MLAVGGAPQEQGGREGLNTASHLASTTASRALWNRPAQWATEAMREAGAQSSRGGKDR